MATSRSRGLARLALMFGLLAAGVTAAAETTPAARPTRLLFGGDVLLSRGVASELSRTQTPLPAELSALFRNATWSAANLEGAVGDARGCAGATNPPCFSISAEHLRLLNDLGLSAVTVENNHAADLLEAGRASTHASLISRKIEPLTFEHSPTFIRIGALTASVVALSTIAGRDGVRVEVPSLALEQKLRVARQLSHLVVVLIHWGSELMDIAGPEQRRVAEWLVMHGADIIVGHHPHVIQAPECISGRPVFFSLGNLVFDQAYPATREGLVADCGFAGHSFRCGATVVAAHPKSFLPGPVGPHEPSRALAQTCPAPLHHPISVGGTTLTGERTPAGIRLVGRDGERLLFRTHPLPLLSLQAVQLKSDGSLPSLFTLQRHYSSLDRHEEPRPYVYAVGAQGLTARWRGSGLAWPLMDAAFLPRMEGTLCALHRGDSFLLPDPETRQTRMAAYRWNGFGFSGLEQTEVLEQCRALLGH